MLRNDLYQPWFADKEQWGFEILTGDFQGVVVQVEEVEFVEESDGEVSLNYHIIHCPEIVTEENVKGEEFQATLELIINDIVREAVEITHEQNRNNDTKKPDPQ